LAFIENTACTEIELVRVFADGAVETLGVSTEGGREGVDLEEGVSVDGPRRDGRVLDGEGSWSTNVESLD